MNLKKIRYPIISLFIITFLIFTCKKNPTTPVDDSVYPTISISCSPSTGGTDTVVTINISIKDNQKEIDAFGLELTFDTKMFQFLSANAASLTEDWIAVDGNEIKSGIVRIGGYSQSEHAISKESTGSITTAKFKVTGGEYSDGQQSQICMQNLINDFEGFKASPSCVTFTYKK
jgi:hypothetical protein